MDFFEALNQRASIRTYKSDPVPQETIMKILAAAGRAPSWGNKQCWKLVVVDSYVEKKIIGKASGQENIDKACSEAPCVIVLCANPRESGIRNGVEYYLFDCALAMENLVLGAQAEGLATCIVGFLDEKAIKGVLGVPEQYRVIAFVTLGYANEKVNARSRKKIDEIVFHNNWGNPLDS